jgi:myo-inositol-1(or 4)-monophosphatase
MSEPAERGAHAAGDLALALEAALRAGSVTSRDFGGQHDVTEKGPDQPLTPADLEADRLLRRFLMAARPDYGWLSEETADSADRLERQAVWIVDPIDGTRSYIAGRPEYAISIGLAVGGVAEVGVVYNPATAELFWAVQGEGGWQAHVQPGEVAAVAGLLGGAGAGKGVRRLRVSERRTSDHALMLASRSEIAAGEFDPFHGGWRITPTGSTAYKLARVAAGAGDVFLSRGPKSEWDVCAGGLLVQEAGGRATDLDGRELGYNRPDPAVWGILASNGHLHEYVLGVNETLPPPARLWRARGGDPLHPGLEREE